MTKSRLGSGEGSESWALSNCWDAATGELPFSIEVVFRNFEGATELAGRRTIRGLPDRDDVGEAVRCLRLAPRVIGLALRMGLAVSCLPIAC